MSLELLRSHREAIAELEVMKKKYANAKAEAEELKEECETLRAEREAKDSSIEAEKEVALSKEDDAQVNVLLQQELNARDREIEELKCDMQRLKRGKQPNSNNSKQQDGLKPQRKENYSENNVWKSRANQQPTKRRNEQTVIVVKPTMDSEAEANRVLDRMRADLNVFKAEVKFKALLRTKSNKLIVKFDESPKESEILSVLKNINGARAWKSTKLVTIYVRDIESDFTEEMIMKEVAGSIAIEIDQLKHVHLLSNINKKTGQTYSTKRAFISMTEAAYEALLAKRDLVIGYTCVHYNVAKEKELICYHCGRAGHKGFVRSDAQPQANGESEQKCVCRNEAQCLHCGGPHGLHSCPVRQDESKKFCLSCRTAGHTALDRVCPVKISQKPSRVNRPKGNA